MCDKRPDLVLEEQKTKVGNWITPWRMGDIWSKHSIKVVKICKTLYLRVPHQIQINSTVSYATSTQKRAQNENKSQKIVSITLFKDERNTEMLMSEHQNEPKLPQHLFVNATKQSSIHIDTNTFGNQLCFILHKISRKYSPDDSPYKPIVHRTNPIPQSLNWIGSNQIKWIPNNLIHLSPFFPFTFLVIIIRFLVRQIFSVSFVLFVCADLFLFRIKLNWIG